MSATARPAVPGALVADVTASLSARWGTPFTTGKDGLFLFTAKRPAGGQIEVYVAPVKSGAEEVALVKCRVRQPKLTVDRVLLDDVGTCLPPLLSGAERESIPAWLHTEGSALTVGKTVLARFTRFQVRIYYFTEETFSLTVTSLEAERDWF